MQRIAFLSAAVLALAACQDKPAKPQSPTAPKGPSLSTAGVSAAAAGSSTVCLAYVKDRDAAKAALAANPSDADAQAKITSLDAVIADACN